MVKYAFLQSDTFIRHLKITVMATILRVKELTLLENRSRDFKEFTNVVFLLIKLKVIYRKRRRLFLTAREFDKDESFQGFPYSRD
jgi:hypothetical protein